MRATRKKPQFWQRATISGGVVLANHRRQDFNPPPLIQPKGIASAVAVVAAGRSGALWGAGSRRGNRAAAGPGGLRLAD